MHRHTISVVWLALIAIAFQSLAIAQSAPSANSGINTSDTWVTADLTIQTQNPSLTFSNPIYNPVTQTTSNVFSATPVARHFHLEAGYDPTGGLVMNLWPTDGPINPYTTDASPVGAIRVAAGQVSVFDQSGNLIPLALPNSSIPMNWPLNLLGSNPGPSVLSGLVVPDINTRATALNASVTWTSNPTGAALAVPLSSGGTSNWTYVQSGSNWLAQQFSVPVSNSQIAATFSVQFANLNWSDNSTNDATRANTPATMQPAPVSNSGTPPMLSSAPSEPEDTPGPNVIAPTNCDTNTYNFSGAQNIVLQHGIWSSSCAWTRMANWLNQDFLIGNEIIPSLDSNAAIDGSQGPALINEINSIGGNNYILIGHSQGGLVSRYAAQYFQNTPVSPVEGVVTIDTPHQGANLTLNTPLAVTYFLDNESINLWGYDGCLTDLDNWGCYLAALMFSAGTSIEPILASGVGSISWSQLQPGSSFLGNLNSQTENFKQAAVVGLTPQRFAFTRVAANAFFGCNPEDGLCGEEAIAGDTEAFYDALVATELYFDAEAAIDCSGDDECNCDYDLSEAQFFAGFISLMDSIDSVYNTFIDFPGDGSSDAIVQGPSQYYPKPTAVQYVISGADSHTGALKSLYDHTVLDAVLTSTLFNVPTPGSCAFSVSNSPYSASAGGIADSFGISTTAGCQWSAVSQTPWISVTSGVNGTSSGTVDFSVQANPSTVPRQGSVQVGNGTSSAQFVVSQAGEVCTYALSLLQGQQVLQPGYGVPSSPPLEVAASPSGGSGTVWVNTSQDCPWSAVPNENWLSISSGSTGTGTGSFNWSAAPNSLDTDQSGTISVMGQILAVVDGNPVGTPGTGSVTIQGAPRSGCSAGTLNCITKIWETGTVTVTIGSGTFSVTYSGSGDTSAGIANFLANEMNYPDSPIVATVSGPTITITSVINGAATNYPLSVSYTFDGACRLHLGCTFNTPAFTATASGSQLTGGTD